VNLCGNEGAKKWAAQQGEFKRVERLRGAIRHLGGAAAVPPGLSSLLMKTPLVRSHKRIPFQQLSQLQRKKCVHVGAVSEDTCLPVVDSRSSGSVVG